MKKPVRNPLLDAAQDTLERAELAVRYRRGQVTVLEDDLDELAGWRGWLAGLMGTREQRENELVDAIKAARQQVVVAQAALADAQQGRRDADEQVAKQADAAAAREGALEQVAEKVRATVDHPARRQLLTLEEHMQVEMNQLGAIQEGLTACLGLLGALANVGAQGTSAMKRADDDLFGILPFASTLAFLQRREVKTASKTVPEALARFNDACAVFGMAPLDLEVPDIGSGWLHLAEGGMGGIAADYLAREQVVSFMSRLQDERELVRSTMTFLVGKRDEHTANLEVEHARRLELLQGLEDEWL